MQYHHPVYDHAMVRAQFRQNEIQGKRRSWFCGAYWGFGFHEDGFRSGHEVAEGILAL
jgi:predicted NAD/FAD-binding protein